MTREMRKTDEKPTTSPAKLMPHSIEAEQAVLGSLILDPEKIALAACQLTSTDFYRLAHGTIFRAMLHLQSNSKPVDIISLKTRLEEIGKLDQCGGYVYLMQLAELVPTSANLEHYAGIVKEKQRRRKFIGDAVKILESSYEEDLDTVTSKIQDFALSSSSDVRRSNMSHVADAVSGAIERMLDPDEGIESKIPDLDFVLGGLARGTLTIVAASPGMGKTQLAIQYAISAAEKEKLAGTGGVVVFLTVEMPKEALAQRMILRTARIDSMELKRNKGRFSGSQQMRDYKKSAVEISSLPIFMRDASETAVTADEIPILLKSLHMENLSRSGAGVVLFVVDYLQAIKPPKDTPREASDERRVSDISTSLRELAVYLDIPILAVSAISRSGDLRHSGQINYDAHNILFIESMDDKDRDPMDTAPTPVKIEVRKQRDGITGAIKASFVKRFGFFAGYTDKEFGVAGEEAVGKF